MQDAFAYCAELVRTADRDRYLATLFAPAESRNALYALYAFNVEVSRLRDVARQPLAGEIRLQWWREVVESQRDEEARANPVACGLRAVLERDTLVAPMLAALIDARRFDLYDEPMQQLSNLEAYARRTSSAVIAIAACLLSGTDAAVATEAVDSAGIALAIVAALRKFPLHAARGQLYLPLEILDRHGVKPHDIFTGCASAGLEAALAELRHAARRHLAAARASIIALPREALPAVLPVAVVRPLLDRLERSPPFSPADLLPWRRQWLIWRGARKPARIAA